MGGARERSAVKFLAPPPTHPLGILRVSMESRIPRCLGLLTPVLNSPLRQREWEYIISSADPRMILKSG